MIVNGSQLVTVIVAHWQCPVVQALATRNDLKASWVVVQALGVEGRLVGSQGEVRHASRRWEYEASQDGLTDRFGEQRPGVTCQA